MTSLLNHSKNLSRALLVLILIVQINSFAMEGIWKMHYAINGKSSETQIQFSRSISDQGKIVHNLKIFACKGLKYSFEIYGNRIFFDFIEFGTQVNTCDPEQIRSIRSAIDSTFTFFTLNNALVFFEPTQKISFRLEKPISHSQLALNGVWKISTDGAGKEIVSVMQANGTNVQLCEGLTQAKYTVMGEDQIRFYVLEDRCQPQVVRALIKTAYYRTVGFKTTFYNVNVEEVAVLSKLEEFPADKSLQQVQVGINFVEQPKALENNNKEVEAIKNVYETPKNKEKQEEVREVVNNNISQEKQQITQSRNVTVNLEKIGQSIQGVWYPVLNTEQDMSVYLMAISSQNVILQGCNFHNGPLQLEAQDQIKPLVFISTAQVCQKNIDNLIIAPLEATRHFTIENTPIEGKKCLHCLDVNKKEVIRFCNKK